MQTHDELLEKMNGEVVATVNGRGITRGELQKAFNKVKRPEHWKYPVRCTLDSATDDDLGVITEAVIFFTGSVPSFRRFKNGKVEVRAAGYYNAVGT